MCLELGRVLYIDNLIYFFLPKSYEVGAFIMPISEVGKTDAQNIFSQELS